MNQIALWLNKRCPQNYLIRDPYRGALITAPFCFLFLVLYTPLKIHPQNSLSFEANMAIYSVLIIIPQITIIPLLKNFHFFAEKEKWNILKETIAIALVLLGMGVFIYFMGFIVEGPEGRWRLVTFFDSLKITVLTGFVLYCFFSAVNFRYWNLPYSAVDEEKAIQRTARSGQNEDFVQISSRLKSESLRFYPSQFLFATSDSNYVIFYLIREGKVEKEIVRSAITDIEKQLCTVPCIFRTHRAFIVNLKKLKSKRGNTLGYKIQLDGYDGEIPVARNKIPAFNKALEKIH